MTRRLIAWPVCVLCVWIFQAHAAGLTFDSATNGFWAVNNATEAYAWSDPDRRRPQAGDTTRVLGHIVTLRQAEQTAQLEFQGGELICGAFPLTLLGDSTWSAGTVSGRLINQAALTVAGTGVKRLSGTVFNEGTLNLESGASLSLDRSSALTNPPGSTFQLTGTAGVVSSGSGGGELPVLAINGTLRKTGSDVALVGFGVLLQNAGVVEIDGGELHCEMPYVQTAGATRLAGTTLSSLTSVSLLGGELTGTGTLKGSVMNAARLRPDSASDSVLVEGGFAQSRAGTLALELAGTPDAGAFSRLVATGSLNLRGAVEISVRSDFMPAIGAVYPVLRGSVRVGRFTQTNLVNLPGGLLLVPQYLPNGVDLLVQGQEPGS